MAYTAFERKDAEMLVRTEAAEKLVAWNFVERELGSSPLELSGLLC